MVTAHDFVTPPGEYIRDELEARGWTQEAFAHIVGRPLRTINQIIQGKTSITPQTAQEIAAAFGTSAEVWLNLESAYRLALSRESQDEVSRRAQLYELGPVRDMIRRQWIKESTDTAELEAEIQNYFAEPFEAAARKSTSYEETSPAQRAWMYRARQLARRMPLSVVYNKIHAEKMLSELHALTTSEQESRHVPVVLGKMGIRFLIVEHLPHTKIDGATMWLDDKSPVIVLSLRFDRIDGFWFTLCHELMHVLNGDKISVDSNMIGPNKLGSDDLAEIEQLADSQASEFLIPATKLESFILRHRPRFSKVNIIRFANLHKIHPGIVVGQLQNKKLIQYTHSREMLAPVRSLVTDATMTDGWGHFPGT